MINYLINSILPNIGKKILLSSLSWIIYLETSPYIRGIWLRYNASGQLCFCIKGIIKMIVYPFFDKRLWNIRYWDINYFTFVIVGIIILSFGNKYL